MKYPIILLILVGFFATPSFGLSYDSAEYRFIDFSYHNYFGESITFILEKTALDQCNSYVAEITNENGKVVWTQKRGSLCVISNDTELKTSQIKLGFEPHNKINLIADYGKYFLKIQIDGKTIETEFLLQARSSGISFDRTVSSAPLNMGSPLKQFKDKIPYHEIKCKPHLQLTQRYDGSPACIKSKTVFELIKRGWVSDIIVAVQSRDVFLEQDVTSSYMEKIVPTLDDFKYTLSESHDINNIFSKFGEPHKDIGSGIHIYVYELNDSTEVWIGYGDDIWYVKHVDHDGSFLEELTQNENTLRPDDRLEVKHSAGYTTVFITLSSWDEYYEWEKQRGSEHDAMPPIPVDENSINPIVFDLLIEMWKFEDYEVSKYNKNLFVKTIQKDYGVSNHHGIHDWLEKEYDKAFGKSNDGFSSYFEFEDRVYHVTMLAVD
ncbi:hypothetical protein [Nitrosopumilus sp.]|uniref:hypothetical protein n=1 Tax=Nitrosopumilus sp. TaxID=2024843 RepID=UPI003D147B6C